MAEDPSDEAPYRAPCVAHLGGLGKPGMEKFVQAQRSRRDHDVSLSECSVTLAHPSRCASFFFVKEIAEVRLIDNVAIRKQNGMTLA